MLVQYAIDIRNFTIFMANPYQVTTGQSQTGLWGLVLASSSSLLTKGSMHPTRVEGTAARLVVVKH